MSHTRLIQASPATAAISTGLSRMRPNKRLVPDRARCLARKLGTAPRG